MAKFNLRDCLAQFKLNGLLSSTSSDSATISLEQARINKVVAIFEEEQRRKSLRQFMVLRPSYTRHRIITRTGLKSKYTLHYNPVFTGWWTDKTTATEEMVEAFGTNILVREMKQ